MSLLSFLHRPDSASTATTVLELPTTEPHYRDQVAALMAERDAAARMAACANADLRDQRVLTVMFATQIIHLRARLFRAELELARLRNHDDKQCWVCYPAGGAR